MGKNVFFLKDSRINEWLLEGFARRGFPVQFIGMSNPGELLSLSRTQRILSLHTRYIQMSLKSLFKSKKGDVIICFLDVIGLYVFLLSSLLLRKREIVAINIMFNDGSDIMTSVKKLMFRLMLQNKHVFPTVTSSELPVTYKKLFRIDDKHFFILHDCFGDLTPLAYPPEEDAYVFCGGINGRDWKTLVQAASMLPAIRFVVIGPKKDTLGEAIPSNIEYYFNVPYSDFQSNILNCKMVALPLDTEAPAGLIVLFSAGLMHKPVITTNNFTLRDYITSGESGFLIKMGDHNALAERIRELDDNKQKRYEFGEKLFEKVMDLGSPDVFIDKIIEIVKEIKSNK